MKKNAAKGYEKTKPKQTQSNPTCSELACPELAEGVEPISKAKKCCCGFVKLWASNNFHGSAPK